MAAVRAGGWPRWVWLGGVVVVLAAAAAIVVVGVDGGGDGDGGSQPAVEDPGSPPVTPSPSARAAVGPWRTEADPDNARLVAPAPDGGAWVGTRSAGLVHWRADGSEFQRHRLAEDGRARGVHAVAVSDDGTVWAATHRVVAPAGPADFDSAGLARFDGQTWTSHELPEPFAGQWVSSLTVDDRGRVWVGVESNAAGADAGIARFADGQWTRYTSDDGAPAPPESLVVDADGAVWAAHPGRVARFDGGDWTSWSAEETLPGSGVSSLSVGRDGVWVATYGGVARFADGAWASWSTADAMPGDWVTALDTGPQGRVWAVTASGRPEPDGPLSEPTLARFEGGQWSAAADDVPFDDVGSLIVDDAGTVWAVTRRQVAEQRWQPGLARFDGRAWQAITRDAGLPHGEVHTLAADDDGGVWVGTAGGVARHDGGAWTQLTTGVGPAGEAVTAMAVGDGGALWTGGAAGVARLADGEWTAWDADAGLPADHVHSLAMGPDGTVWAGTADGLSRFDGQEWTSPPADDGLGSQPVRSVAVAGDGTVWAAVGDVPAVMSLPPETAPVNQIARLADRQWTTWTSREAAGAGLAVTVSVDDGGTPWVAVVSPARAPGQDRPAERVLRFDAGQWRRETTDGAIPGDRVGAIDAAGEAVWAGTNRGLARFDGQRWRDPLGDRGALGDGPVLVDDLTAVAADTAWVGLSHGVARVVAGDDPRVDHVDDAPFKEVKALAARDGLVWIGTDHGLVRLDAVEALGSS
jgi:ligand-binding sensor domain-containing protein